MADHEHGEMDITEQEQTFESFIRWTMRTVIVIIVLLIFLAILNA